MIYSGISVSKESACSVGDLGSIPGSGRSSGEGNGNPLQYSCLGNPMSWGAWQAAVLGVTRVGHDSVTNKSPISHHHNGKEQKRMYVDNNGVTLLYSRNEHNIVNQLWKWRSEKGLPWPAMQEIWVPSLAWEDSPEEGNGNPLQFEKKKKATTKNTSCILGGQEAPSSFAQVLVPWQLQQWYHGSSWPEMVDWGVARSRVAWCSLRFQRDWEGGSPHVGVQCRVSLSQMSCHRI